MFRYVFVLELSTILLFSSCFCLESPEPEVFLQPRNFNPHPYAEGGRVPTAIQSLRRVTPSPTGVQAQRGPVLFPTNPEDGVARNRVDTGHPYAGVVRKQKAKFTGKYDNDQENSINPRVYSGLANYAAKVLKKVSTGDRNNDFTDPSLAGHKKNYAFSYTVRDQATGDDFSHSQSQNAAATNGEYRVKLPDGRVQIVSYTADNNGYKADVKYSDDDVQQVSVPVQHRQQVPVVLQGYDYYNEPQQHRGQVTQVEVPIYDGTPYQNQRYQPEYVTIYPEKISSEYLLDSKYRIYPSSFRGNIESSQNISPLHGPVRLTDNYNNIRGSFHSLNHGHSPDLRQAAVSVSTISPPLSSQVYITNTTPKYSHSIVHGSTHLYTSTPSYFKRR